MVWVSLLIIFSLVVSLLTGLKEGVVKHFFNLIISLIAIFVAGIFYRLPAGLLSFIPGENWENFLGFFISYAIVTAIMQLISFIPRRLVQKLWKRGLLYRVLGGAFNLVNASIGLVVFALVLSEFPIFEWLARWVEGSSVMSFLVQIFGFIHVLLPEEFHTTAIMVASQI